MRSLQLGGIASGALLPHAPLLLDGVAGEAVAAKVADITRAARSLEVPSGSTIVVLSPHGVRTGVYRRLEGNLDAFGIRGSGVARSGDDELAGSLAEAWGAPLLEDAIDHGALVPLSLLPGEVPVVAAALREEQGRPPTAATEDEIARFVAALAQVAATRRLFFVASVHTGAALAPAAPLTKIPAALDLERKVVAALSRDIGELVTLAGAVATTGGSCSGGVLQSFGRIFAGEAGRVIAYGAPFGVGYIVARVDR